MSDAAGELQKWDTRLSVFDFDINHKAGISIHAAEALLALHINHENITDVIGDLSIAFLYVGRYLNKKN